MKNYSELPPEKLPIISGDPNAPPFSLWAVKIINNPEQIESLIRFIWENGYSRGLKDMDKMHQNAEN